MSRVPSAARSSLGPLSSSSYTCACSILGCAGEALTVPFVRLLWRDRQPGAVYKAVMQPDRNSIGSTLQGPALDTDTTVLAGVHMLLCMRTNQRGFGRKRKVYQQISSPAELWRTQADDKTSVITSASQMRSCFAKTFDPCHTAGTGLKRAQCYCTQAPSLHAPVASYSVLPELPSPSRLHTPPSLSALLHPASCSSIMHACMREGRMGWHENRHLVEGRV